MDTLFHLFLYVHIYVHLLLVNKLESEMFALLSYPSVPFSLPFILKYSTNS